MKTWKPDTCECEVEEIYNGNQIVGGGQVLSKCSAHQSVADEDLYGVLYSNPDGENKRKNQLIRGLLGYEGFSLNLHQNKAQADGQTIVDFKDGVSCSWSFTGTGKDRVLQVSVVGATLTTNQKNALKNFANTKFGVGKVELI